MATETITTRVCDMPHTREAIAAPFQLYSKASGWYEVDLCEGCAAKIIAPAIANGRKLKGSRKR